MNVRVFWKWFGSIFGATGITLVGTKLATDPEFTKQAGRVAQGVALAIQDDATSLWNESKPMMQGAGKAVWKAGQRIDRYLRLAFRTILFWPLVFIALAMLPRDQALFWIPIAAIAPLAAIAFLCTQRPLLTGIAMLVPKGRDVIGWSVLITCISAFIGIVLAILPLANDRTLVPLFFACLIICVLPFERIFANQANAGRKQYIWMKQVAALIAFVVAVVLVLGGRTLAQQRIDNTSKEIGHEIFGVDTPAKRGTTTTTDNKVANTAWPHVPQCRNQEPGGNIGGGAKSVTMLLYGDCYHGLYTVPATKDLTVTLMHSRNPGDEISIWCKGRTHPSPLYSADQDIPSNEMCPAQDGQYQFCLLGHGEVALWIHPPNELTPPQISSSWQWMNQKPRPPSPGATSSESSIATNTDTR